ncbi:hypothetical protein [Photorhabdus sp. CRCIA-P01]|uniref:hypothetical protein n=1 Tax=Photorhabdus sp. CRCIA-P01 TaxID=2019570 RepID=UPI0018E5A32C|nr:hypothetical protein [Photorhabdus sp. CRCIA-P01]
MIYPNWARKYRNNMTEHMLYQLSVDNQKDILAAGGYALVYGGHILIAGSAEMATAGRIALEGCKANPALCLNNVGIFVADAVAPEAAVGTGVLAAGAVKVLGNSKEGAKNLAEELSHASEPLLSNAKPDTHAVASLIENEKLYVGKGTINQQYLTEMSKNGVKFSPENVLRAEKLADGKIVFLEKGNSSAGLQHIVERHVNDFAKIGVSESQIPNIVMDAVSKGKMLQKRP